MDPTALALANNKLAAAVESCHQLANATSYEEAEQAWSAFLQAAGTVYAKLEQGAKSSGKSQGWYGRRKGQRNDDPLLRYLHFARNSDQHGIEFGTMRNVPTIDGQPVGFGPEHFGKTIPVKVQGVGDDGKLEDAIDGHFDGPNIALRTVTVRQVKCPPPTQHLGSDIEKSTPQKVAQLGLDYLIAMLREAKELPPSALKSP